MNEGALEEGGKFRVGVAKEDEGPADELSSTLRWSETRPLGGEENEISESVEYVRSWFGSHGLEESILFCRGSPNTTSSSLILGISCLSSQREEPHLALSTFVMLDSSLSPWSRM